MLRLIFILSVFSASASAREVFVQNLPTKQITKLEAMKILLTSDNKANVYKCQPVELSSKGTVKNK